MLMTFMQTLYVAINAGVDHITGCLLVWGDSTVSTKGEIPSAYMCVYYDQHRMHRTGQYTILQELI